MEVFTDLTHFYHHNLGSEDRTPLVLADIAKFLILHVFPTGTEQ